MPRKPPTVHGMALIDKPSGMTSHDVVAKLRKRFNERRIGHAGTLDPDATGVLVIGIGSATRLLRFATASFKTYEVEIVFGLETTTLDSSGDVVKRHLMSIDEEKVLRGVEQLTGEIEQTPPMVSARRVDGRRLHEIAREGGEVERAACVDMGNNDLLCCPEDQFCQRKCKPAKKLCYECQIPICASCRYCLRQNQLSPMALMNENFVGYLDPWIYPADITWMEKQSPLPSGLA